LQIIWRIFLHAIWRMDAAATTGSRELLLALTVALTQLIENAAVAIGVCAGPERNRLVFI
jgi:hypothetical protein